MPALQSGYKDPLGLKPKMGQLDQTHFRSSQAPAIPNLENGEVPSTLASIYRHEEGLKLRLGEVTNLSLPALPPVLGWARLPIGSS
jgi:hypothetical protein